MSDSQDSNLTIINCVDHKVWKPTHFELTLAVEADGPDLRMLVEQSHRPFERGHE